MIEPNCVVSGSPEAPTEEREQKHTALRKLMLSLPIYSCEEVVFVDTLSVDMECLPHGVSTHISGHYVCGGCCR